jgi:large subunit ribosomal protein L22
MADKKTPKITEAKAFARYIHVSPQKLRLVANLIRKSPVDVALEQLRFSSKNAALPLAKCINSAVANAVHNYNLDKNNLYVKTVTIDGGPVFTRYAPRAQGRAFTERKRTSHISVVLESRERKNKNKRSIFSIRPKSQTEPAATHKEQITPTESGDIKKDQNKPQQARRADDKKKGSLISLKRRLFNRRTGP